MLIQILGGLLLFALVVCLLVVLMAWWSIATDVAEDEDGPWFPPFN